MIKQHFLQQQRLNYNHDRLLERYQALRSPHISEFRAFGTSSLPGRNYDQYFNSGNGNRGLSNSLVALSRAGIGSSNQTYRFMGDGASEILPRNVNSFMKHSRQQSIPLVHAEKFEPVQVYEHPIFGPTPAYIRPIYNNQAQIEEIDNEDKDEDNSDNEEDDETQSRESHGTSSKADQNTKKQTSSGAAKNDHDNNNDDDDVSKRIPAGYVTYKEWKKKYENLIPVNPLLYSIYTKRPNGSINKYGQSLYASLNHLNSHTPSNRNEDVFTPTLSDIGSVSSETPRENSSASSRRYHRLQPPLFPASVRPRSLDPILSGDDKDLSEDELSPPDSPVPYLSRNRPNSIATTPSTPIRPTSGATTGITSSLLSSSTPTAPITSTLNTSKDDTKDTPAAASTTASNIPAAPPMPAFLMTTTSNPSYQTSSGIPTSSLPIVPPAPKAPSNSSSNATYQTPSSISVPLSPAPPVLSSATAPNQTKAVTFGGSSSFPIANNDASSSSDSEDEEKKKQKRRKKKQAQAAAGVDVDSSSSDD